MQKEKNLKYVFFVLFIISLASCSCSRVTFSPVVDDKLKPYFEEFVSEMNKRNVRKSAENLVVKFDNLQNKHGLCEKDWSENTVTIDIMSWGMLNEIKRRAVIFHELGHCILYREHDDELLIGGRPKSLMHSSISVPGFVLGTYLLRNWHYYLDELFLTY